MEPAIIAIAVLSLVPVWIIGVLTIVFLSREGYASIKDDVERRKMERSVR